jgi:hypothetical protein
MLLAEILSDDLKKALKTAQKDTLSVIRMIKAAVKNKEIEKGAVLSDEEIHGVLMTLARQRKDSIEQFSKGNRQDLVAKETDELSIIQSYLPKQISKEEVAEIIKDAVTESNADGPKDIGKVMKAVMAKVKGRADGRLVSALVKETLSGDPQS